jgi:hypothetical protein
MFNDNNSFHISISRLDVVANMHDLSRFDAFTIDFDVPAAGCSGSS